MTEQEQIKEWANKCRELNGEDMLCEMANFLHSRHKELPSNIWVSVKNASHGPRIKIQRNKGERMQIDDTFSMTISDEPNTIGEVGSDLSTKDIAYFKNFVLKNKDTLLAYWDGELDTSDLTDRLESLPSHETVRLSRNG